MSSEERANGRPSRRVDCEDVLEWLKHPDALAGSSVIASMPDFSEFPQLSLEEWRTWFTETAAKILSRTPDTSVALFFQSDIKRDGVWIDKAFLVQRAAESTGHAQLFHKVLCRAPPGQTTFGKPAYSHLLAFSRTVRPSVEMSTADVIPDLGEKVWPRGMGLHACRIACEFIREVAPDQSVTNLFCGEGSVLAMANHLGLDSIGVERSTKRAERARELQMTSDGSEWAER